MLCHWSPRRTAILFFNPICLSSEKFTSFRLALLLSTILLLGSVQKHFISDTLQPSWTFSTRKFIHNISSTEFIEPLSQQCNCTTPSEIELFDRNSYGFTLGLLPTTHLMAHCPPSSVHKSYLTGTLNRIRSGRTYQKLLKIVVAQVIICIKEVKSTHSVACLDSQLSAQ